MTASFNIRNALVCDDARREMNGKSILIGVYNDVIVLPQFPFIVVPKLVFYMVVNPLGNKFSTVEFRMTDSAGNKVFEISGGLSPYDPSESMPIVIQAVGLTFASAGTYTMELALDGTKVAAGDITARLPKSPQEQQQLAAT